MLNFPFFKMQVIQLTGFSDPVYAEAYVNVNQYDIVLDVLVVNQTSDTLQGLSLELATLGTCITCLSTSWIVFILFLLFSCCILIGDLRLVERPSPVTLGSHDFANIKASIKVSSTENGIIFGNIGM